MATYMIMFHFTQKGIENVKETPARVESAKRIVKSVGGEVKTFYGVLGGVMDTMFVVDAPNDETVTKAAMAIASLGNVRTTTHRIYPEDEFRKLIAGLP